MSRVSLKTDFKDGEVLHGKQLNTVNQAAENAINDNYEEILKLQNLKADVVDVTDKLATKVDITTFNDEINSLNTVKANVSVVNTKADKSELALKADKTELQEGLSVKADTSYVDNQLSNKANISYVDNQLGNKEDKSTIGNLSNLNTSDKTSIVNAINSVQIQTLPIATIENVGIVKPDGTTTTIDIDGTLHAVGGGGGTGGTSDYNGLTNRPSINNIILEGNKTSDDLNLMSKDAINTALNTKANTSDVYSKEELPSIISSATANKADKSYVDAQLSTKANILDTYTKEEVDAQIDTLESTFNSSLNTKANASDVYNKTEVNELIEEAGNTKANVTYVDEKFNLKADKADTYTKEEVDNLVNDGGMVSGDTFPIGAITSFAGGNIPQNWLLCDGREVSRADYSDLFAVIGTTYGEGDGALTFKLPDRRGLVAAGIDTSDTNLNALGKTYGEKTHTLTVEEMPNHNHVIKGCGNVDWGTSGATTIMGNWSGSGLNTNNATQTEATGGGQPHNNMQPTVAQNFIIKAKQSAGVVATVIDGVNSNSPTDALSARQGKLLNDKTLKKLWENPNSTSSFPNGNITLNSADYDYLIWIYQVNIGINNTKSALSIKGNGTWFEFSNTYEADGKWLGPWVFRRIVDYISDTEYRLLNSEGLRAGYQVSNHPESNIPLYVYGGKF